MALKLGIVGGGQLGLFLGRAAHDLGLQVVVLTPERDAPAAAVADELILGQLDDLEAASALADRCDVITFEIEAVAPEVLKMLAARSRCGGPRVAPAPEILLVLQNKALQKQWLVRHGLPTPDYLQLAGGPIAADELVARFGLPLVQKSATGGYDGKGVQIIRTAADLHRLWTTPSLVEAFVADATELGVLVARGVDGSVRTYEPVLLAMDGADNVLDAAISPAPIPATQSAQARALAEQVVCALQGVGLFAVEMFLTDRGELLINEISPRVHNSGHLTLEACRTSQFAQQVRAVAGMPLGDTSQDRAAAMINVLFEPALKNLCLINGVELGSSNRDLFLHWYGKQDGRPKRKMGHITARAADPEAALTRARSAAQALHRVAGAVFA
ncbi:MAG: 5-(carboxyamino)imidazole ribonucleotide synthase [Pseudomonadales bacterium]